MRPTGAPDEKPVSVIVIPAAAAVGLYSLKLSAGSGRDAVTSQRVVRVFPRL